MTAAFNAPERGDSVVANQAKTSDTPQFDLKSLYSDMNSTLASTGSAHEKTSAGQLDFGSGDKLYSLSAKSASADNYSPEQQGSMAVARAFASFDNGSGNAGGIKFDAQDVLNGVQVLGDMDYVKQSLNQGNTAGAKQWLGELQNDMTSFQQGLSTDSPTGSSGAGQEQQSDGQNGQHNHERHGHHGRHHDSQDSSSSDSSGSDNSGSDSSGSSSSESSASDNSSASNCPPENSSTSGDSSSSQHSDCGSESGTENSSAGTDNGGTPGDSSSFTPQDSMVLLANDMQQLSQALASGDSEKAQQIMAAMDRHMTNLMMQLNPDSASGATNGDSQSGTDVGTGTVDQTQPASGDQTNFNPLDPGGFLGRLNGILNPGDLTSGLTPPNPSDILGSLPQPGDILGSLPQPPNPADILGSLPQPGDILGSLPKPPNPQDLLNDLPQLPGLPKLPNPGNILGSLPSPGDLFNIF